MILAVDREFKWYEVRITNLGERSLRVFDNDTGLWIICFDIKPRNKLVAPYTTLCYHWNPANRRFVRIVRDWYTVVMAGYSYCRYKKGKGDVSKNLRVEAVGVKHTYDYTRRREYGGFKGLWDKLKNDESEALEDVSNCLKCFSMDIYSVEKLKQLNTSKRYVPLCYYDRCYEETGKINKHFEMGLCRFDYIGYRPRAKEDSSEGASEEVEEEDILE